LTANDSWGGAFESQGFGAGQATVIPSIPQRIAAVPLRQAALRNSAPAQTGGAWRTSDPGHGPMNILIADDHTVVRQGLKQILAAEPDMAVVGEARNALETLNLARSVEWDALILDYSMPDGNGLSVLKEIKHAYPRRAVLILSMHPEDEVAISVLRAGAAGYINKECASDELTVAIRKAVSGKKYVSASLAERLAAELEDGSEALPHESLSDREYRVMWMIASGKSITHIAEELSLSPNTVSTYRIRILKKLRLDNNAELVRYAIKHRLMA
jgi:DNA-binding NarL/FixJ family response regulator